MVTRPTVAGDEHVVCWRHHPFLAVEWVGLTSHVPGLQYTSLMETGHTCLDLCIVPVDGMSGVQSMFSNSRSLWVVIGKCCLVFLNGYLRRWSQNSRTVAHNRPQPQPDEEPKAIVTLPYIRGISESIPTTEVFERAAARQFSATKCGTPTLFKLQMQ